MTAFTLAKLLVLVRSQISQDSDKIVFLKSNSGLTEAEIRAIKCLTSNKSQEKGNGSKKVSISKNK
jgi:Tfp pilus assembly protein PilN